MTIITIVGLVAHPARADIDLSRIVFFDPGSAEVPATAERTLKDAVVCFETRRRHIVAHGHADAAEADMALSQARADAVNKRLVEMGVPADRVATEAHGDTMLLVKTGPGTGDWQNRRTEIVCR